MLSELVLGRSIEERRELTAEHLIEALDGVPPEMLHCPALATGALRYGCSRWEPGSGDKLPAGRKPGTETGRVENWRSSVA